MKRHSIFLVAGWLGLAALTASSASWAQSPTVGAQAKSGTAMTQAAAPKTAPLDINTASKTELMGLSGVGDKRADAIIAGRPYKGKDELVQKNIVPKAVYDGIKGKIVAKQK